MAQIQACVSAPSSRAAFPILKPQSQIDTGNAPFRPKMAAVPKAAERECVTGLDSSVRTSVLSFANMHQYGDLLVKYLMARHDTFIVRKGWVLPESEGMEFDQYDTPYSRWVIMHEFGEVIAGVRLMPTTTQCGLHSYMIRDAQLGLLPDIPKDLLNIRAPQSKNIWEATRLFMASSVPANRRGRIQNILMYQMSASARELGARHLIGIVPSVFSRWMTRLGLISAVPVGRVLEFDGEKAQAALMNLVPSQCDVVLQPSPKSRAVTNSVA